MDRTLFIAYSAALFFVLTVVGLALLKRAGTVALRTLAFLAFCVACIYLTLWTTSTWHLAMGESALAWIVALLLFGAVEGGRVWQRKRAS